MTEDDDLKHLLRRWEVTPPDAGTQTRMINTAMLQPQVLPWPKCMARELELAFTQWAYALPYKLGAGAACLLLGAGLGGTLIEEPVNIANLALMTLGGG